MGLLSRLLSQRRLILLVAGVLTIMGAVQWQTMVRQEDPRLPNFWGQMVVAFPGADAEMVERLVLEPIEEQLAEVAQIRSVDATAYAEMAVLLIELRADTTDPDEVWDEVRVALKEASADLPEGVSEPRLNDDISGEQESVVLAVTGSADPLRLLEAARSLKDELIGLPQVAKTLLLGAPQEQVRIELEDAPTHRLGLTIEAVAEQLRQRTSVIPGGSLHLAGKSVRLRPLSELGSIEEIAHTPILLPDGTSLQLQDIARVYLAEREPVSSVMRYNGEMSVGLSLIPRRGCDLVSFGEAVRTRLEEIVPELQGVSVHEVAFQPARVSQRLQELSRSLVLGILIVAGVVVLAMGLRLGLVVAMVVPLVASISMALYGAGGGVLHQISIAALVLALGMLVDNAIVVAENIQWRIERGQEPGAAAIDGVRELAVPLAGATGTTMAAFVPMLLAEGPTAEFTRAIPVLIMLTLSVSYLFAMTVTPLVVQRVLPPKGPARSKGWRRLGAVLADLVVTRTALVLVLAGCAVVGSMVATRWVRQQFFPSADRNQLTIELKLAQGAHLEATDRASRSLERELLLRPEVRKVAAFVGRGAPKFYYNIQNVPYSPHSAQLIVETQATDQVEPVLAWVREYAARSLLGIEVVPRKLEQGPPVVAPIEVRLYGASLAALDQAAALVRSQVRALPGTREVRHDLGPGAPTVRFALNDAAAARVGVARPALARALYGQTRGLPVGFLRSGDDPIPIVLRSSLGEQVPFEDLETLQIATNRGGVVPLAQLAKAEVSWRPAAIAHRDRRRVVRVTAQLGEGTTFSEVLSQLQPRLAQLELPPGVSFELGGDAEGSSEANAQQLSTLPLGLLLLLGILLAEFNSFRRVAIILTTVPLGAAGVVPGLLLFDQPFGFMSMLGVIACVGIVVNNAIVLLEVVESARRDGAGVSEAIRDAVQRRIRPILLTTATTVAGLLPLACSASTLWPPLASAMISGLLVSTLLTLVVVPALYKVLLGAPLHWRRRSIARFVALKAGVLLALGIAGVARAEEPLPLTLAETMARAQTRPAAVAWQEQARAAELEAEAARRSVVFPVVASSFSLTQRDRDLELVTPLGGFAFGNRRQTQAGIELRQPLLEPSRTFFELPASRAAAAAASSSAQRQLQLLAARAADLHLDLLGMEARCSSTQAYVTSLEGRLQEIQAMVAAGRALHADELKLRLALEQAEHEVLRLQQGRDAVMLALAQAVNNPGPIQALPVSLGHEGAAPTAADLLEQALQRRPDVAALHDEVRVLSLKASAIRAEALPRLDARATWSWADGSPYDQDDWLEGALVMQWAPFAGATRGPRAAAVKARQRAAEERLREVRRSIELEISQALQGLTVSSDAIVVADRGLEYARQTLRVERERHHAGRSSTNDLLEAEAQLHQGRTARDLARLEHVRARVKLWLATLDDLWLAPGGQRRQGREESS